MKTSEHTTLQTKNTVERTLFTDWMGTFVFSPDGTQIASPGLDHDSPNPTPWYDDILRLTDVSTGRELTTFPGVGAAMTFSPDGKILAYSRRGNKIHLLNIETGEILDISLSDSNYSSEDPRRPEVRTLLFAPDGKKLVSGNQWRKGSGVECRSWGCVNLFLCRRTTDR